jgi:ABC-type transporter Mla subunit MlaD
MSTTKDLQELKAQLDEGITRMRDAFGVMDHDLDALSKDEAVFHIQALESYQHDDNALRDDAGTKSIEAITGELHAVDEQAKAFVDSWHALAKEYHDAAAQVEQHAHEHDGIASQFTHIIKALGDAVGHAATQVAEARAEHLQEVQNLTHSLGELGEHLFGAAKETEASVRQQQAEVLDKAIGAMKSLVEHHATQTLPQTFAEAANHLAHDAEQLASHTTQAADMLHHELETFLHDVGEFAAQQVHDKVEQKFAVLLQDAVGYLASEITESVAVTVAGAATTAAMAPIIPELAMLKGATEIIKDAIELVKTVESIF